MSHSVPPSPLLQEAYSEKKKLCSLGFSCFAKTLVMYLVSVRALWDGLPSIVCYICQAVVGYAEGCTQFRN